MKKINQQMNSFLHNSSTKKHRRLRASLSALSNPNVQFENEAFNRKHKLKKWSALLHLSCLLLLCSGCEGATGKINASDPVERGCSYIAAAIVTSALIRAAFNK